MSFGSEGDEVEAEAGAPAAAGSSTLAAAGSSEVHPPDVALASAPGEFACSPFHRPR